MKYAKCSYTRWQKKKQLKTRIDDTVAFVSRSSLWSPHIQCHSLETTCFQGFQACQVNSKCMARGVYFPSPRQLITDITACARQWKSRYVGGRGVEVGDERNWRTVATYFLFFPTRKSHSAVGAWGVNWTRNYCPNEFFFFSSALSKFALHIDGMRDPNTEQWTNIFSQAHKALIWSEI